MAINFNIVIIIYLLYIITVKYIQLQYIAMFHGFRTRKRISDISDHVCL